MIHTFLVPQHQHHDKSFSAPPHLVEVAVGDLLQRLYLVDRNEMRVKIHELNGHLLELSLSQQVTLDALKGLMRVVIRLGKGKTEWQGET